MKIGLLDIDNHNFPNLALMKISAWHKKQGHNVEFATMFEKYDIIYKSKIFTYTVDPEYCYNTNKYIIGGTGINLKNKLPDEIESIKNIDYSIYNYDYSIQLFSRGCIRNCKFCIVPEKEGKIYPVKPMELNEKGNRIEILDNNFFANSEWKTAIEWLKKTNQPVNFHGVDIRILTEEQCFFLNQLKHYKQIKIAWDNPEEKIDLKIKKILKYIKPYKLMCYVLIGFNSTQEQDYYRIKKLKDMNIDPFVMAFKKDDPYQKNFARWVNHKAIFKTVDWKDYA